MTPTAPSAVPTQTAAPFSTSHAQATGPIPSMPYANIINPTNGMESENGATYTLNAAVPVYNIGTANVAYEFVANSAGNPVAVQVGTTTTYASPILSGANQQGYVINGKTAIFCFQDGYNFNNGAFPSQPIDTNGVQFVDYFACAGNPFI